MPSLLPSLPSKAEILTHVKVCWDVEVDLVVFPSVLLVARNGLHRLFTDAGSRGQYLEVAFLRPVLEEPEVDAVMTSTDTRRQQARPLMVMPVGLGVDVVT